MERRNHRRGCITVSKEKLIYVADDDNNIRQAIRMFLENEGYRVEDFSAGEPLMRRFSERECDLVILDVMMPGADGFEICREIRRTSIVPIIFLTARDTDIDYATGMQLGSDDYFTKPFSAMALSMRVKAIFRRIEFENQRAASALTHGAEPLELGGISISDGSRQALYDGHPLLLTPNEFELLRYLMKRRGEAVSREELLQKIWGYETVVETRVTDDAVRRLRKKLEQTDVQIETVWGYGFRLTRR